MTTLEALKLDDYRIGDLQAIVYDRKFVVPFPPGFLSRLYFAFRGNRFNNRDGDGVLECLFCGMSDLSHDAIVDYWLHHPLVVLGIWHDQEFRPMGCCFPAQMIGKGEPERACYGGYGFIRSSWGTEEQEVLALLGIAVMFSQMDLAVMHGTRFTDNEATAKFMERFGFRDVATLPKQLVRRGKLVDVVISTLYRDDFEAYVDRVVSEAYANL